MGFDMRQVTSLPSLSTALHSRAARMGTIKTAFYVSREVSVRALIGSKIS